MLKNVIRFIFLIVGAITGYVVLRTVFSIQYIDLPPNISNAILIFSSAFMAAVFYFSSSKFIKSVLDTLDRFESLIQGMTLYELAISAAGLVLGLVVANLVVLPVSRLDIIGLPLSLLANILFGCIGVGLALTKKNERLFDFNKIKDNDPNTNKSSISKLLDTSAIIDGRIIDVYKAGFVEGNMIIPSFVLEELRLIADSSDLLKRSKGRRGLDIIDMLQKELSNNVIVEKFDIDSCVGVDDKLLVAAKTLGCKIVTVDYNLNKVAKISGIEVLNVNELSNAVKPVALPGEEMTVQVVKDGKENGQGIGYLEDGTMIVVEGGRKHIGETLNVLVTSVLQTSAGRMIFAKPKSNRVERVI